jgi:hypothetical protein
VPLDRLPRQRHPFKIFGIEIANREEPIDLHRLFMARFGDIARIEGRGRDVLVTLKSGAVIDLDRFEASDFDDGVRVWDAKRGVVDLDSLWIRSIEFLPTPRLDAIPRRLHGTVRTRHGDFTGFVQWDRRECVGSDALAGRSAEGEVRVRFDAIRSIARRSRDSAQVNLLDGRQIVLTGTRSVGHGNRGLYVDDGRYGRVLVSWDAFERVEFDEGGSGPGYQDFGPGRPLNGTVTTRSGRRLAGRLVYDLDESETTDTLDAPSQGVDYTVPLGLIARVAIREGNDSGARASVTLISGERLSLERAGDLGDSNAGMLVFAGGGEPRAEYVPWADIAQIEFERAIQPPQAGSRVPPRDRRSAWRQAEARLESSFAAQDGAGRGHLQQAP